MITGCLQQGSATFIARAFRVLAAVGFDDDPHFLAEKVGYKSCHRRLAAKFKAKELAGAQHSPELFFGLGFIAPQFAGNAR
jgi:hypothetical protein